MKLEKYRISFDEKTNIESFNDGEDSVTIEYDGELKIIYTHTRGTSGHLYKGLSMEAARESLQLTNEEWDNLLATDVEYLSKI